MVDLSQGARDPLQDAIRDLKLVKEWRQHAISSAAEKDRRVAELEKERDELRASLFAAGEATGVAGVDAPMTVAQCVAALRGDRDALLRERGVLLEERDEARSAAREFIEMIRSISKVTGLTAWAERRAREVDAEEGAEAKT